MPYGRPYYGGASEEAMVVTSVLTGLASLERQHREALRDKDKFRESFILQDRRLKHAAEESRLGREETRLQNQFNLLVGERDKQFTKLEKYGQDYINSGITRDEWAGILGVERTGDFGDIVGKSIDEASSSFDKSLYNYKNAEGQIEALTNQVRDLSARTKYDETILTKMRDLKGHMDAELPRIYSDYKDFIPSTSKDPYAQLRENIQIDPQEMKGVWDELIKLDPKRYGDIKENEELQDLVRREMAPMYEPELQRQLNLANYTKAISSEKTLELSRQQTSRAGYVNALVASGQANLALMSDRLYSYSFKPGKPGVREAEGKIKDVIERLQAIKGMSEEDANSLGRLLVKDPKTQLMQIGKQISSALNSINAEMTDENASAKSAVAREMIAVFRSEGMLSLMDDDELAEFDIFYDRFISHSKELSDAHNRDIEYYRGLVAPIDINKATKEILEPKKKGISETNVEETEVGDDNDEASVEESVPILQTLGIIDDGDDVIADTLEFGDIGDFEIPSLFGDDSLETSVDSMYTTGDSLGVLNLSSLDAVVEGDSLSSFIPGMSGGFTPEDDLNQALSSRYQTDRGSRYGRFGLKSQEHADTASTIELIETDYKRVMTALNLIAKGGDTDAYNRLPQHLQWGLQKAGLINEQKTKWGEEPVVTGRLPKSKDELADLIESIYQYSHEGSAASFMLPRLLGGRTGDISKDQLLDIIDMMGLYYK